MEIQRHAQGSAYKDLQNFIAQANPTTARNTFFVAIADGNFYQNRNGQARMSRIDRLRNLVTGRAVHACTINDLEALMVRISERGIE